MSRVIILDSSPLALLVQRQMIPQVDACRAWVKRHVDAGTRVLVPEIVRYERRRELAEAWKRQGPSRSGGIYRCRAGQVHRTYLKRGLAISDIVPSALRGSGSVGSSGSFRQRQRE